MPITPQLLVTSTHTLKTLAAIVWYIGGIVLIIKGGSLLLEADTLDPNLNWPWYAIILGFLIGSLKATFIFRKSCKKNLIRIDSIIEPKVWQFYRAGFFVALIIMIFAGLMLSRIAHGNYFLLISIAVLDISIAVALLGSSYIFWKQ